MDANASRLPSGLVSPRHVRSRTQSISSDRPSTIGYGVVLPPVFISPPAAFIASSAASQIITNDHDSHADAWYDQNGIDPAAETATVSASALQLVNSFLDQLLFNVLQVSKSTGLSALRPAVIEVLKPKLGRDVVSNADEELREYLGGANEEDQEQFQGPSSSRNWDGELVWKRTRLRCMVYSSLGDMEEEDEDAYMEEENLDIGAHEQISDTISPPVAIFLTSVIEYMGELTLTVAGQAAYQRVRSKIEKELKDGARNTSDPADRIVVTDLDMERVALDRTLGRLWRGWKKRMRTPANDIAGSLFPKGPPTPCKPGQMEIAHDVLSPPKSAISDSEKSEADQDTVAEIGIAMSTDGHGSLSEANAEPIAADVPAKKDVDARSQSSESDYDGTEEVAFEKAEIMTTSRISMSSSAQSTDSDSNGKATPMKRSSSVHSARIIDVPAPRSPARSRPTSLDATEQLRPVRVSGIASGFARTAASDDRFKATSNETPIKAAINALPPRSSHDKRKPSASNTSPISELEEETSQNFTRAVNQPDNSADATEIEAAGSTSSAMSQRRKGIIVTLNTKIQSSSKYEQPPVSARTVSLPATPASPDIAKGNAPDLPKKASVHSGWNSPKPETKSRLSIERTRTHESDELSLPAQQQNTSGSRQVSQAHTSVSSVSSGASRLKPVRTSEDSSSRSESVARNFEELIQSNQTITYTLTPENMRDIDAKRSLDSPVVTKFARRKSEDARAHQYSPKASPILTPSAAVNLPSPRLPPSPASPKILESRAIINPAGPVPPAPTTITAPTARANGATAREARVRSDSVSDFAEFIKSTGPAGETKSYTVPKLGSPPLSSDKGYRESRRASATGIVNRLRYQPRDATVDSRVDNSDLIDFIRQGPPIAASNHRIPRHVAPFRTTMDSDQMSGAVGGKAIDANIPDIRSSRTSTNVTESSMPSMQSSVNSKSALIKHKAPKIPNKLFDDDDNMMPKPKTRRVRDPYAIDFSDEEGGAGQDDHILDTPKLPVKKEESLAEFLRNYEPPPEPVSAPAPRLPRKKASAPSLIGRFTRGGKDKEKEKDSASIKGMPEARSVSRASSGRGYIPIQVNIPPGYDKYNPMNGNIGANRARGPSTTSSTAGRVPMKKFEPREAASKRSETADLAAFFRDSGPPLNNSPMVIDRRSSQQEDSGGLTKRFGRKKKPLAL
ncbi:hypothetical protein VCV18_002975 [Metarhizium anisopliae]